MSFCTRCGTQVPEGSAFCTTCGAPRSLVGADGHASSTHVVSPVTSESQSQQAAVQQTPAQQAAKKGGHTVLLAIVGVILFALIAGGAGLVYAGYKVKQKAKALLHSATSSDADVATNAQDPKDKPNPGLQGADATTHKDDGVDKGIDVIDNIADRLGYGDPPPDPYSDLEVVKIADGSKIVCPPAEAVGPANAIKPTEGRIPMREGLIVTGTWGRELGDVDESMKTSELKPESMTLSNSGLTFTNSEDAKGTLGHWDSTICAADLKSSHGYMTGYYDQYPETLAGATREMLSAHAFQQLKQTGKLSLRYLVLIKTPDGEGFYKHWQNGELERAEPNDIPYSVIVNDSITTLPAIHARGMLIPEGKAANNDSKYALDRHTMLDLKVFDDPLNPLVLLFKFEGDAFRIEVTKIEFPNQAKKIEQELAKNKKAVVYGIYFDFNSDKIKPESKQVLTEIADALKDNTDWKLTVDGHTDNIGGDAYNLDLSKRRSAAVKQALVTQYHVRPDRLSSTGSGVAGAIDTNDTIIGRSHNRRVELTRQ
jgi:hypothetical protein